MSAIPSSSGQAIPVIKPDELLTEVQFVEDRDFKDGGIGGGGGGGGTNGSVRHKGKIGHRRIDKQGEVSYKRVPTNALMGAIQLGIANSIGSLANTSKRDILIPDFQDIDNVAFPSEGSQTTPSHTYGDFRFKTYAPQAFRYFRDLFNIKPVDLLKSLCTMPLKELSNSGASGSIFYVSADDKFIIKTVQHKEAEFLRTLLPGYYINVQQNPRTLLPKFFGLFCYQSLGKNIRLLVMNNLLPQTIKMHHKFDLKGSTYKRFASKSERAKENPTLKDLDFNQEFRNGIMLDASTYDILMDIIKRDCLVLKSFKIMDYSLLMGVHNIDLEMSAEEEQGNTSAAAEDSRMSLTAKSEAWKALQLDFNTTKGPSEECGVPARNAKGERLLLFLGIIDILQSYRLFKKLEHTWKSVLHDGDSISVTNPAFYANRFQTYITETVFHKSIAMKQTPAKQPQQSRTRSTTDDNNQQQQQQQPSDGGGRPEAEALLSQRSSQERRSYYGKNPALSYADPEKKKRIERLFTTTANNAPNSTSGTQTDV